MILLKMAFQNISPEEAFSKIKHYCAYQERSHGEVKNKLYLLGVCKENSDQIIADLITENYLNEERFAANFAGGKFRIRQWGKNKITQSLRMKQVSDPNIKKALKEIDEAEYLTTFRKLAEKKMETLSGERNILVKKRKLRNFLLQRGYEINYITEEVQKIGRKVPARH
ncbi:MAG: regulatory protein RecX [Ginsengibacter sp.]